MVAIKSIVDSINGMDIVNGKDEDIALRLLGKYMAHIINAEGIAFLRDGDRPVDPHWVTFTDEEWQTLRYLADAISY